MEVGPFRTIPADQTKSGDVELKLVNAGWEEFATIVFSERRKERVAERKADDWCGGIFQSISHLELDFQPFLPMDTYMN